jgi:phosphoglycolate phosphatase
MLTGHCPKLLIFDWDGTLADSATSITLAMQTAIDQMGLDRRSSDTIRNIIGLGLDEAIIRLFPSLRPEDRRCLADNYRQQYLASTRDGTPLFPGVKKVLRDLHAEGYLLAVATGKSRRGLDRVLKESGLGPYFQASRCADETLSKPHPRMLQEIMDILDSEPCDSLMVGDSEYDLQMAANAGVAAIAVTYGAQKLSRLLQYHPLACLNSLDDLWHWLNGKQSKSMR